MYSIYHQYLLLTIHAISLVIVELATSTKRSRSSLQSYHDVLPHYHEG